MAHLIQQYRGRVVDSPGDNILAEFASVVDAAECTVKIQRKLKIRNDEIPVNRKMEFCIGINLGDVIEEEARKHAIEVQMIDLSFSLEGLGKAAFYKDPTYLESRLNVLRRAGLK